MNMCQKCSKEIPNGETFVTLDYNIETMKMDAAGLSVEVISSETIHMMCQQCAVNSDPQKIKAFLKNIGSQNQKLN